MKKGNSSFMVIEGFGRHSPKCCCSCVVVFVGVFSACKKGDLEELKNVLPYVPEAINEIMNEDGDNLLMWYVQYVTCVCVCEGSLCMYECASDTIHTFVIHAVLQGVVMWIS